MLNMILFDAAGPGILVVGLAVVIGAIIIVLPMLIGLIIAIVSGIKKRKENKCQNSDTQ